VELEVLEIKVGKVRVFLHQLEGGQTLYIGDRMFEIFDPTIISYEVIGDKLRLIYLEISTELLNAAPKGDVNWDYTLDTLKGKYKDLLPFAVHGVEIQEDKAIFYYMIDTN
jgi:hypothetical protein